MPLPEQVIEQLGREPIKTPGWAVGLIAFSGCMLFFTFLVYFGITYGFDPYLATQITQTQDQINHLGQSVTAADQTNLVNYFSQISNLQTLLKNHIHASQFFAWLEKNTEANVYYNSINITQGGQVSITGSAKTEADVNEQIAIFENAPEVDTVSVSNVTLGAGGSQYLFTAALKMKPVVFAQGTTQ